MGIPVGSYPSLSQLPHSKATPRTLVMGPPVCLNRLRKPAACRGGQAAA